MSLADMEQGDKDGVLNIPRPIVVCKARDFSVMIKVTKKHG